MQKWQAKRLQNLLQMSNKTITAVSWSERTEGLWELQCLFSKWMLNTLLRLRACYALWCTVAPLNDLIHFISLILQCPWSFCCVMQRFSTPVLAPPRSAHFACLCCLNTPDSDHQLIRIKFHEWTVFRLTCSLHSVHCSLLPKHEKSVDVYFTSELIYSLIYSRICATPASSHTDETY